MKYKKNTNESLRRLLGSLISLHSDLFIISLEQVAGGRSRAATLTVALLIARLAIVGRLAIVSRLTIVRWLTARWLVAVLTTFRILVVVVSVL